MGSVTEARGLAHACVGMLERRWAHVEGVGRAAEQLAASSELVSDAIVCAAWLHDVGYGPSVRDTGLHALDGARYLQQLGTDHTVVSLVAFHTGAHFEADERGLGDDLAEFAEPSADDLDLLTMIDLAVSPDGTPILDSNRLAEVLQRYDAADPVARAVERSQSILLTASQRAKRRLGLPNDWPAVT